MLSDKEASHKRPHILTLFMYNMQIRGITVICLVNRHSKSVREWVLSLAVKMPSPGFDS